MAMGSRIKNLFFGKSSSDSRSNKHTNLQAATPYDSILASKPPTKGSYPVAGNGPDVLEQIQKSRAKRRSQASLAAPSIAPRQEYAVPRPRTAPHDGAPSGGPIRSKSIKSTKGRTMSGFSMKSPPTFFGGSSRRNSIRSNAERPPLPLPSITTHTAAPKVMSPPAREVRTYIPTTGTNPTPISNPPIAFSTPSAQHSRAPSRASRAPHKAYVDLLEAHSTIKQTKEASLHRYKASGARSYGEDVADRNIGAFGPPSERDSKLDLNSPEFSYLKSVYASKKSVRTEPYSRGSSALGHHALGADGGNGDDTHVLKSQSRTNSMRSTRSGPIPAPKYPPRVDSTAGTYVTGRNRDVYRSTQPNGATDSGGRTMSLSNASIAEENLDDHKPLNFGNSTRALDILPIPERGRTRPINSTTKTRSVPSVAHNNPPPVAPPSKITSTSLSRQSSATRTREPSSSKSKQRSMSTASERTDKPPAMNGGTGLNKGPVSFAAFGEHPHQSQSSNANPQKRMIVEGASQPPSLEGIVDLRDSVDTDVTTTQLPAVVHEHVTHQRNEIRQELITREIHTHDVYHRVLPVIETEILPTKHYVRDGKNLIEIPESMVPTHKVTGRLDQSWHISKPGPTQMSGGIDCESSSRASTESAPDGPIIGLARGEPRHTRGDSRASSSSARPSSRREPILSSKKEYITKDGVPRTEYIWRHPPVFETVNGKTQPVYVGVGVGDISGENYADEDDELRADAAPTVGSAAKGEEDLLYRDTGYGSGDMLPGLKAVNPSWTRSGDSSTGRVNSEAFRGKGSTSPNGEGEVTQALGRTRERRRSSAASKMNGHASLDGAIKKLSIK